MASEDEYQAALAEVPIFAEVRAWMRSASPERARLPAISERASYPDARLARRAGLAQLFARGMPRFVVFRWSFRMESIFDFTAPVSETDPLPIAGTEVDLLLLGFLRSTFPMFRFPPQSDRLVIEAESGRVWLLETVHGGNQWRDVFVNSSFAAFEATLSVLKTLSRSSEGSREARRAAVERARAEVLGIDPALDGTREDDTFWLPYLTSTVMDIDLEESD